MTEFEERLRRSLADAAAAVPPSFGGDTAWAEVVARIGADDMAPGFAARTSTHVPDDTDGMRPALEDFVRVGTRRPQRPRRALPWLGLAAAVVAAAAVGGTAVLGRHSGRPTTIAVAPSQTTGAASGPLPRFLLGALPAGFALNDAQDVPSGAEVSGLPQGRVVVVNTSSPSAMITVLGVASATQGAFDVAPAGPNVTAVAVHNQPGRLMTSGQVGLLRWEEQGASFTVSGAGDARLLVGVGNAVVPGPPGHSELFTLGPLPEGLRVGQTGTMADAMPRAEYSMSYGREDLNAPANDSINVSVTLEGLVRQPLFSGLDVTQVIVRGHPAQLTHVTPPASIGATAPTPTILAWEELPGVAVTLAAVGLDESQLVALASGLHPVTDAEWRAAAGAHLSTPPSADQPTIRHFVARGTTTGIDWQLSSSDPSATGDICLKIQENNGGGGGCGPSGPGSLLRASTGFNGLLAGLVSDQVATVVVRARGSQTVLTSTPTVTAAGWTGLRAVVMSLPTGGGLLDIVGLDASGHEVARTEQPPMPPVPPQATPPAMPDFSAVTRGPVLTGGELDGHPWTAQAAVLPIPAPAGPSATRSGGVASSVCVVITYALGQGSPVCEPGGEFGPGQPPAPGFRTVQVANARRVLVVALVDPGVTMVRAQFAAGSLQTVATLTPTGGSATDPRFAVIPVVPGTTLVAVVALGRGGQVIGVVNGNVTGQSDQPWTLGTSGGGAGSGYITSSSSATAVPVQPATANSTATTVGH